MPPQIIHVIEAHDFGDPPVYDISVFWQGIGIDSQSEACYSLMVSGMETASRSNLPRRFNRISCTSSQEDF